MKKTEREVIFVPTATVISLADYLLALCRMLETVAVSDKEADTE